MLEQWLKENPYIWVDKYKIKAELTLKYEHIMISFEYNGDDIEIPLDIMDYKDDTKILMRMIDGQILSTGIEWTVEDYIEDQIFENACCDYLEERDVRK